MIISLFIDRLRIHAYHGVLPQEQTVGAWFYVTLTAKIQCDAKAYLHDELTGTVNYADIVDCINREFAVSSKLLERLVYRTGLSLLDTFPQIITLSLSVSKENPPMKAQCENISIKMEFSR